MDDKLKAIPVEASEVCFSASAEATTKVRKSHQVWLFTLFAIAWCSGVAFFVLKTWFMVEGDFGPEKHPWQFPTLQIHGFTAFLMMVTFGCVLGTHVQQSWNVRPRRILGIILVALPVFQMVTSYLLYYVDWKRDSRAILEYMHLGVGFILPLILIIHVLLPKFLKNLELKRLQQSG